MKLIYTPKSREDLREIKAYIKNTLSNKKVADNIGIKILKDCALLKDNPLLGISLDDRINRKTDVRYLIIKNYIAFYKIENDVIKIIRIREARTNYLSIILKEI